MSLKTFSCAFLLILSTSLPAHAQINIQYPAGLRPGAAAIEEALEAIGEKIVSTPGDAKQVIEISVENAGPALKREGFTIEKAGRKIHVKAPDPAGARYGAYDLAESILLAGSLEGVQAKTNAPDFEVRAIKFNLPWSAYRESKSMEYHLSTCRDLKFWDAFLNMMAENRFNTLLLYNKHPFPFMVKLDEYPEACPFSDREMAGWQYFWKSLFSMAKKRGIEVFIVNWNIVVSEGFAEKHGLKEYNDTSQIVVDYTRKSVSKLIDTYADLAGVGVTLADWMNGLTPAEKEDWIAATFIEGMRRAKRKVKFLHRAVLSGSSDEMRRILKDTAFLKPVLTEVKFNWSHGHSTPRLVITHASESGEINTGFWDPAPENYRIQWMIRNEDFFILRWGAPDFIRDHIRENTKPYVNGYHIGSEGYIPAYEYFTRDELGKTWQYAFERQWLFYMLWGRLLYDRDTPDKVFELKFDRKYGEGKGAKMLEAYRLTSRMPLRLAAYFKSTWDYTLYSEGFLSAMHQERYSRSDHHSPFISIDELIDHDVLDPRYLSVKNYVQLTLDEKPAPDQKTTPIQLADELLANAARALELVESLSPPTPYTVEYNQELDDIRIWALLSRYFAHKLKAAVHLDQYRQTNSEPHREKAVEFLQNCLDNWLSLSATGSKNYKEVPYWESRVFGFEDPAINYFSWEKYIPDVERDLEIAN